MRLTSYFGFSGSDGATLVPATTDLAGMAVVVLAFGCSGNWVATEVVASAPSLVWEVSGGGSAVGGGSGIGFSFSAFTWSAIDCLAVGAVAVCANTADGRSNPSKTAQNSKHQDLG